MMRAGKDYVTKAASAIARKPAKPHILKAKPGKKRKDAPRREQ